MLEEVHIILKENNMKICFNLFDSHGIENALSYKNHVRFESCHLSFMMQQRPLIVNF